MALENLDIVGNQLQSVVSANPAIVAFLVIILIWKLIWYGLAIFKSIEKKQKNWFVVLFVCAFVLNDAGILAILYLAFNREFKAKTAKKK